MYWEWRRDVALFLIAPCSSNAIAAYILCARLLHLLPSATQHIRTCLLILKECLGTSPENDMNDRHSGYKNYYFRHQQLFLPPSIQERTCFSIPLPLDYPGTNEMRMDFLCLVHSDFLIFPRVEKSSIRHSCWKPNVGGWRCILVILVEWPSTGSLPDKYNTPYQCINLIHVFVVTSLCNLFK